GTEFTTSGLVNGETVGSVTLGSTGSPATAGVGAYPITLSAATGGTFTAANYTITYTNSTLTVNKAVLTLTANNQNKTFGALFTFNGSTDFTPTGLQNNETVGSVTLSSTGSATTAPVVGGNPYSILISAATGGTFTAANYAITYVNGTLTVGTAPLTITANPVSKTYGSPLTGAAGSTAFTSSGLVPNNTIASVTIAYGTGAAANATVGTYTGSVTATAPVGANSFVASNYSITYVANNIVVDQAALSITANNQAKVYGTTFTFAGTEFTQVGLKNTETIGSVSLVSAGTPANASATVYSITAASASGGTFTASNYNITYTTASTLTVTKANTTVVTSSNDNSPCFGTSITLTAIISTSYPGQSGTVQFFDGATSLGTSSVSNGIATLNISTLTAGSHSSIKATYSGDGNYATSTSSTISVVVNPLPTLSSTLAPSAICQNTTFNYTPTSTTPLTIFSWSRAAIAGITNAAASGTGNPAELLLNTTASAINVTYDYILSANGCSNGIVYSVVVSVKPTPVITSATSGIVCSAIAQSYLITNNISSGTAYSWSRATVTGISNAVATNLATNPITESLTNTTTTPKLVTYLITPTNIGCANAAFSYQVTVNPPPTTAVAGPDQTGAGTCGINSTLLAANQPTVGTGSWSMFSNPDGAGVIADPTSYKSTFSGSTGVDYILTWTITNSPCNASVDNVKIRFNITPPAADAGTLVSLCSDPAQGGTNSINITAGATASFYTTLLWTSNGSGTFTNATSLTGAVYAPSAADKSAGAVILTLTALGNGVCNNAVDTKTVTFGKTITNNNIVLFSECSATPSTAIVDIEEGATLSGGDGNYTYTWGFSSPGNSGPYNTVAGQTSSNLIFTQAATNGFYERVVYSGGCVNYSNLSRNTVHINSGNVITAASSYIMTGGGNYCIGGTGIPIGVNGSDAGTVYIATYQLFRNASYTGISVQGTGAPISFGNQTIAGNYTVQVTISVPGGASCAAQVLTGSKTVTIDALATTASTGISQTLCNTATAVLAGNVPSVGSGLWSVTSGTGSFSSVTNATPTVSGMTVGGNIYRWTITNGTCSNYSEVTITNNKSPLITTQPTAPIATCSGTGTQTMSVVASGTGLTYSWRKAGTAVVNGGAISGQGTATLTFTNPTTADAANYDVVVTGNCSPAATSVSATLSINTAPSITNQPVVPAAVCPGSGVQTISVVAAGTGLTYSWRKAGTVIVNGGVFSGQGTATLTLTNPAIADAVSYDVVISGTCTPSITSTPITVVLNTAPLITSQPVAPAASCIGNGTQTISVTATGTGLTYTWRKAGATIPIGGVFTGQGTSTLVLTNATNTDVGSYDVVVTGTCATATSNAVLVKITSNGTWLGFTNDWNNSSNWCGGVPTASTNAIIPVVGSGLFYPATSSATAKCANITILPGASVIVNNFTLQISGVISNSGSFDVTNGTLNFNGTSTQNIAGSYFKNNTLKNLTISSSNQFDITKVLTADSLNITGTIAFGSSNNILNSNGNLVLVSDAAGTAMVADMTNGGFNGNIINGVVTVQRYFESRRAWRLFTAPVSGGGSIFDNWQNGGIYAPGKGTYVSGVNASTSNGLDWTPLNNSSLKVTTSLVAVPNTYNAKLSVPSATSAANIPYFIFVRGDRDPINYNYPYSNNTTLSSKGVLQTGTQTFPVSPVANGYTMIGNPYAAPVGLEKIILNNVEPLFYMWDPFLNTDQGGYVTFIRDPVDGSYSSAPARLSPTLQSGQACYVLTTASGAASVVFQETSKSTLTNLATFRPLQPAGLKQSFRVNLLHSNTGSANLLLDGVLAEFDDSFNNGVDNADAPKGSNVKEMIALTRNNKALVIERKTLVNPLDTLFLQLTKTTQRNYQLEFEPKNMDPLLTAFLEDSYTGAKTPINILSKSVMDFTITADARSSASNRFRIVFKATAGPLPVTYKAVKAYQQSANIAVEWTVENEINTSRYEVEKSVDGVNFTKVNNTVATGANRSSTTYSWLDVNPLSGNNFYRIRNIDKDGSFEYSNIVLVKTANTASGIRIYPNPVENGVIGAEFKNMASGVYSVRLINSTGQTVFSKRISHAAGSSMEYLQPDYLLPSATYQLEVTSPGKEITVVNVIVK
ncbi:MAG: MBG domain-containing protein, partial [Ferruginibacter sp.]